MFEKSASDSSCITGRHFTSENRKSPVKKLGPGTIPVAPSFIHFNFNVQIEPGKDECEPVGGNFA
jgi:hypothetical protein